MKLADMIEQLTVLPTMEGYKFKTSEQKEALREHLENSNYSETFEIPIVGDSLYLFVKYNNLSSIYTFAATAFYYYGKPRYFSAENWGFAIRHESDQYNKRTGIQVAVKRSLFSSPTPTPKGSEEVYRLLLGLHSSLKVKDKGDQLISRYLYHLVRKWLRENEAHL